MPPKEPISSKTILAHSELNSGLYLLILGLAAPLRVRVGALGKMDFRAGCYVYCGSARRNLFARLRRHATRRKKKRWHIDYLTSRSRVRVESAVVLPAAATTECELFSEMIRQTGAQPIRRFGSSDCRCGSHLAFAGDRPPEFSFMKSVIYDSFR